MQMYKIAMYFAAVGLMFGALQYIMVDVEGDNWFDQDIPQMNTVNISASDAEDLQFDGGSGILDESIGIMKYGNLLMRLLQGVFLITSIIGTVLVYDHNGVNLFFPILALFQVMIYAIYIIGVLQFISNRQIEVMS